MRELHIGQRVRKPRCAMLDEATELVARLMRERDEARAERDALRARFEALRPDPSMLARSAVVADSRDTSCANGARRGSKRR